ncbi:hypothetical protein CC86DRAFT_470947 [Ophiobolus disseminans]|uniref:Uncharacterized protein n=1 Tax=Ophiobolus disseminans TaxID=1469910 RepID=A0A6A6ZLT9_9PLEO|nr:hypothetical protein CC86DRAFT_470947 [Ophiobolus disseminans]
MSDTARSSPERTLMSVKTTSIAPSQQKVSAKVASRSAKAVKPHLKVTLEGEIKITFNGPEERTRATGNLLPRASFPTSYEESATLNRNVPKECFKKHRDNPHLKLAEGNTFQNIGDFNPWQDMVPPRIRRHYNPQMFRDPSPFVSSYHTVVEAETRAYKQYNDNRKVGQRVTVTMIDFKGLVPATMHGTMASGMVYFVDGTLTNMDHTQKTRRVKWPGVELRKTGKYDMDCGAADTHDNEWLCCGPVPDWTIMKVMPLDGNDLHPKKTHEIIKSLRSIEKYVYNWDKLQWQHNPDMTDFRSFRLTRAGHKRRPADNEDDDSNNDGNDDNDEEDLAPRRKRAQVVRSD